MVVSVLVGVRLIGVRSVGRDARGPHRQVGLTSVSPSNIDHTNEQVFDGKEARRVPDEDPGLLAHHHAAGQSWRSSSPLPRERTSHWSARADTSGVRHDRRGRRILVPVDWRSRQAL